MNAGPARVNAGAHDRAAKVVELDHLPSTDASCARRPSGTHLVAEAIFPGFCAGYVVQPGTLWALDHPAVVARPEAFRVVEPGPAVLGLEGAAFVRLAESSLRPSAELLERFTVTGWP